MPMLKIMTNFDTNDLPNDFMSDITTVVADMMGKPEKYVMVSLSSQQMAMGGSDDLTYFLELRSIGKIDAESNKRYSKAITDFLVEKTNVDPERVYINFIDISRDCWGNNGTTF
eukprot:TRINITY_DN76_c1_g1_i1.p1 TRINITY_DN76_c1_g1~~TRINITY_DN76_c1_g1_i1.p1  ORF type:complete len:114 (+),score=20.90 TRINITY_DN76_c1_g1_i1:107-448(+)